MILLTYLELAMLTNFTIQHEQLSQLSTRPLFVELYKMVYEDNHLTDYRKVVHSYEPGLKSNDIILLVESVQTIRRIINIGTPLISSYTFDAKYLESITILNEAVKYK